MGNGGNDYTAARGALVSGIFAAAVRFLCGGDLPASPCLGEGVVYFASQDGWVYALE